MSTFAFPSMHSFTVIERLSQLFTIFGTPSYIYSDRGTSFLLTELFEWLLTALPPTIPKEMTKWNT